MLDTRCNTTLLLVLQVKDIDKLRKLYDKKEYNWRVTRGRRVAAVVTLVLNIEHKNGTFIDVQLKNDFLSCKERVQYFVISLILGRH